MGTVSRPVLVVLVLLAAAIPLVPTGSSTVVWAHPHHALTPAMNRTLANNTGLAQSFLDSPPVGIGLSPALAVAERALLARRAEVLDGSNVSGFLRRGIDAERANLQSARDVQATLLDGTLPPAAKALALAREGLGSREDALGITSPRVLGYFAQQERSVDALSALLAAPRGDGLRVVEIATSLQAEALNVTTPARDPVRHATPSAALHAYMAARGVASTPALDARLLALDALPTAAALAYVVDAFVELENRTVAAFAAGNQTLLQEYLDADGIDVRENEVAPPERAPAQDWNALAAAGVDVGPILVARADLLDAAAQLRAALAASPPPAASTCEPIEPPHANGVLLFSIDLTSCDNNHTRPTALTVDAGGNDRSSNNAGGNRLTGGCEEPVTRNPEEPHDPEQFEVHPRAAQAAALLDYGGSDVRVGPPCGLTGGASLGAGLLVDFGAGDDTYGILAPEPIAFNRTADGEGVNGGGHGGVGLLLDFGGNDAYAGGAYAVNGGSLVGLGGLVDLGAGSDVYTATFGGTNGGANIGAAFLFDEGGSDRYVAEARTANGGSLEGVSLLVDLSGDDLYRAVDLSRERYATATIGGSHYGAALLYDGAGNDTYQGMRDGVIGGAVNAVATLIDLSGDDRYNATDNGTIGSGWGLLPVSSEQGDTPDETLLDATIIQPGALGMLLDLDGADRYHGRMFGTVGGAYLGASFFVDAKGNDVYYADDGGGAIGGVSGHNVGVGVAFLYEGEGNDRYTTNDTFLYEPPRFDTNKPRSEFHGKGANGGAAHAGGVGFLLDVSGDDAYTGNSTGVNGGAADGAVGLLIDAGGNDWYNASDRGVNGGAYGGGHRSGYKSTSNALLAMGFLVDLAGNDHYKGGNPANPVGTPGQGVNGGGYLAMGFLYDGDGADHYRAFGLATNGGGAGGVGLLVDAVSPTSTALSRTDRYTSTSWAAPADDLIHAANGGATNATCAGGCTTRPDLGPAFTGKTVPAGIGLLVDFAGYDLYEDPEPTNYRGTGRDYNGSGSDQCVYPKGEPGAGHQRDLGVDLHPDLASGCPPAGPGL